MNGNLESETFTHYKLHNIPSKSLCMCYKLLLIFRHVKVENFLLNVSLSSALTISLETQINPSFSLMDDYSSLFHIIKDPD